MAWAVPKGPAQCILAWLAAFSHCLSLFMQVTRHFIFFASSSGSVSPYLCLFTQAASCSNPWALRLKAVPKQCDFCLHNKKTPLSLVLRFAMTINKSQGQTLSKVGLYLERPVFTHGQLYVALSRVKSKDGLKIVIGPTNNSSPNTTKNVVYQEVFTNIH